VRERSSNKFGPMNIPIEELKVIYAYGIDGHINKEFAEKYSHEFCIPLIIDKDNYIIDGHHRYWYFKKNNIANVNVIKLNMTFVESKPWRIADSSIKEFSKLTGKSNLYKQFKELTKCLV